jgi:hypothetical protein
MRSTWLFAVEGLMKRSGGSTRSARDAAARSSQTDSGVEVWCIGRRMQTCRSSRCPPGSAPAQSLERGIEEAFVGQPGRRPAREAQHLNVTLRALGRWSASPAKRALTRHVPGRGRLKLVE